MDTSSRGMMTHLFSLHKSLRQFPRPVISVIYTRTDLFFGIGRLLEQLQNPLSKIRIVVTRDEHEALRLVGQKENRFETLCGNIVAANAQTETVG
ncbi:hypothetical protein [Tropicibacter sp. S64]|uniref:hypothetical protein n=1 Tax=Tropicibacter sp. S64 TaxID=3415122 RepID=UPI003C7A8F5B